MQYTVFLRQGPTGMYEATAPTVPGSIGQGKTRTEALNHLKGAIQDWLIETEITTLEVDLPETKPGSPPNPWLTTAGMFQDDPTLEPMLNQIYTDREAEKQGNQL